MYIKYFKLNNCKMQLLITLILITIYYLYLLIKFNIIKK